MILVFGSINMDLVARVAAIPHAGETALAPGYATLCGGKGANQAVAAARVATPGRVAMAGRVGADGLGRVARDNLQANGVDVSLVAVGVEPTGCAFITVDAQGENAITVASGANGAATAALVPDAAITADTVLVLQMEVPTTEALALARRVRDAGGRVVWNLAPVPPDLTTSLLREVLAVSDVFIANEHEAVAAASIIGGPSTGWSACGGFLARFGSTVCIITAGAKGAVAFTPEGELVQAAAPAIHPVDTTGAGDTFVGILTVGLDEGRSLPESLERACRGAALACLAPGAQGGMPRRADLEVPAFI
ncbi:Ribokinase [Rhodovastum atsumiense]|uniref:Ribokinase n=1 Tax=Rhodovastum atsumiense TaxID=504468 RepID=A0A5M6IMG4_9PROT|nr:ribokinase [Rhodovastum atsumiense]KAA5609450.1 ribokinase [Rhodovastum atsumiense]CAH2603531.1 Ribokinase [Rhodovastum atsumiense]